MSKRKNEADGDDGPSGLASKRAHITPGTNSTTENPPSSSGLKNTLHGNVFQLKLLMLFLLRGINASFQFRLGTEIPGMGGKFDDLIFKFKKRDQTSERYQFLQAKHKQNEDKEKITAADLLKDNDGEFSLPKYFRSFYREIIKENDGIPSKSIQDCIICTNIGFDSVEELKESGIELIRLTNRDEILTFDEEPNIKKTPTRYKLKETKELKGIMEEWSDIHLLAKTLLDYVTEGKQLALSSPIFKSYHFALVKEKVIEKKEVEKKEVEKKVIEEKVNDKKEGQLCTTFLEGDNSPFRKILSEKTFDHYLGKLKSKQNNAEKKAMKEKAMKELIDGGVEVLKQLISKCSPTEPNFEANLCLLEIYLEFFINQKILTEKGQATSGKPFTGNSSHAVDLLQKGLGKLRDAVFIHYWEDLTIQLSKAFGKRKRTPDENKSLKDLVGEKEIDDFLDKLVFAVHTPNEVELDGILKSEVGNYYNLHENDFQSDFILRNMLDWFKEKESKFMTSKEGIDILENGREKMESLRVMGISIDYQKQLSKEVLEFNDKAIDEMKEKLTQLLTAENRIGRITTESVESTAVKVIAALEKLRQEELITNKTQHEVQHKSMLQEYFQYEDSYYVTSSSRLQKNRDKFDKTLKSHYHNLFVVVCEDGPLTENYDEFFKKQVKKRMIIIFPKKK